jgi:hypothetical protein
LDPPDGTYTLDVFVSVVNQQFTEVEEGLETRFTFPAKPATLVRFRVVCRSEPIGMDWNVVLSEMLKVWTFTVTPSEWESIPL